jgi:hypothetical protein
MPCILVKRMNDPGQMSMGRRRHFTVEQVTRQDHRRFTGLVPKNGDSNPSR